MKSYKRAIKKLCSAGYIDFRASCGIDQPYADAMLEYAQPRALTVLGNPAPPSTVDGRLPVVVHVVSAEGSPFGQLMPAWPLTDQRPVTVYALDNWGFSLYLLRATVGEPAGELRRVDRFFRDRSRIQVGITNDILQAFVNYPPTSSYSFVRHHALMLFLAILWLPEPQRSGWLDIMRWCSRMLCVESGINRMADPLGWVESVADDGAGILRDHGPSTRTHEGAAIFQADSEAIAKYLSYLGATSLAVASLAHQYNLCPTNERAGWQTRAARIWHAESDFNTTWILEFLETMQ